MFFLLHYLCLESDNRPVSRLVCVLPTPNESCSIEQGNCCWSIVSHIVYGWWAAIHKINDFNVTRIPNWNVQPGAVKLFSEITCLHGQKFATGSWFDPDPRTRIHSCGGLRRLRGRRHARTASFHHVHGQSRKRNQEFLFQGVDLEVDFFFNLFSIWPSTSNFIFCLFAETLSQTLTWRHAGTPTLSLSLSLTLSLFQVRSGSYLRFF